MADTTQNVASPNSPLPTESELSRPSRDPVRKHTLILAIWVYTLAIIGSVGSDVALARLGEKPYWFVAVLSAHSVAAILIPIWVFYTWVKTRHRRTGHFLSLTIRAIYLSVVLAMLDAWTSTSDRRDTLFSHRTSMLRDGGTSLYWGFGYAMNYHREIQGERGPEIWFWFTPVRILYTSERTGFRWLWINDR